MVLWLRRQEGEPMDGVREGIRKPRNKKVGERKTALRKANMHVDEMHV